MKIIKNTFLGLFSVFFSFGAFAQAYQSGESFSFQISYGLINAGKATLSLEEKMHNGQSVFHANGKGWTTGLTKSFFDVKDDYQSYFDKESGKVYRYVRNIQEDGHKKNEEGNFNHSSKQISVHDKIKNTKKSFALENSEVQDMLSAFYYLRNHPQVNGMKVGESITLHLFFDEENYKFKLKLLGKEKINTKFGKINALKFRPYVQAGRIFKEEESLTVWVSDDDNKMPLLIQADILVGSLKAKLISYKGLKHESKFM